MWQNLTNCGLNTDMRSRPRQNPIPPLVITGGILSLMILAGLWCTEWKSAYTDTAIRAFFAESARPVQQSRNICIPQAPAPETEITCEPMLYLSEALPDAMEIEDIPSPQPEQVLLLACELSETEPAPSPPSTKSSTLAPPSQLIPPRPGETPAPPYPPQLRSARRSGHAQVRIHIDATGKPTHVDIISATHPAFATAAQECILARWHFTPARQGNTPVPSTAIQTILFRM